MIINGNALSIPMADKSVHCIVTSPPYWGLRDYGTAKWKGGDEGCKHNPQRPDGGERSDRTLPLGRGGMYRDACGKCGAIRIDSQLGLERTPDEYVANMVAVFRECWRVLRDDGTCFVNLGDSYFSNPGNGRGGGSTLAGGQPHLSGSPRSSSYGLKPKDLVGIPWRVAFALQADGWYLRSDIIWSKPNPMPESVTDRPTKAHEYLFLLAKQERYYYDAEAVREESQLSMDEETYAKELANYPGRSNNMIDFGGGKGKKFHSATPPGGRNRRTVWTIPTAPYKGAHFATYPPALVEPCIKAGTSERGVCPKCGKGWRRVVERVSIGKRYSTGKSADKNSNGLATAFSGYDDGSSSPQFVTTGWLPSCTCDAGDPIPAIVFDPFAGSGTTVKVAFDLGRRGVGLDLSLEYLDKQATQRIHNGHTGRLI